MPAALLLSLSLATCPAATAQPAPEFHPIPTPPAQQQAVFEYLAARTFHAEKAEDAAGNIIFACFNQHDVFRKKKPDAPGLADADMLRLLHFPELRGVTLQRQPLSDAGYAVLAAFPKLEAASLVDVMTHKGLPAVQRATSRHITFLDGARELKVLDLTHSFGMQDDPPVLQTMRGFPKLKVLVVDAGLADDPAEFLPFVGKCPEVERLKLHRCTFSDAEMARVFAALPNLRWLEMKPSGNTPESRWSHRSLRMIPALPKLEVLRLIHGDALPLPWTDGLEHLAAAHVPRHFMFPEPDKGKEERAVKEEDIARLRAARPDLAINPQRGTPQFPAPPNPVPFNWEIGPR